MISFNRHPTICYDDEMKNWNLSHSYQGLPETFYASALPDKAPNPQLVISNQCLFSALGVPIEGVDSNTLAQYCSGSRLPLYASPIAQAYAGHQFGYLNLLGDGRAILLGEYQTPDGNLIDLQLKGAGRTPYSRNGDGKATLAPMLREYLISEAMAGLGIPTTRSLAVTTTGETVYRGRKQAGAVLVRVAASHLRVGTFVYAAMLAKKHRTPDDLQSLLTYSIERHYPELIGSQNLALSLLDKVIEQQIHLVNHWLRVGFVHGVLNTDNVTISGETIDYGPCAFMDIYRDNCVYSSIDQTGRYAFGKQASITQWNLVRFAEALLPLVSDREAEAVEQVGEYLMGFNQRQQSAWEQMMRRKLGMRGQQLGDSELIHDLFAIMQENQMDYTNTFVALTCAAMGDEGVKLPEDEVFRAWQRRWTHRIGEKDRQVVTMMQTSNPVLIPRNHRVEQVLSSAEVGDMQPFYQLLTVLEAPYAWDKRQQLVDYQSPPSSQWQEAYQTFCGT